MSKEEYAYYSNYFQEVIDMDLSEIKEINVE